MLLVIMITTSCSKEPEPKIEYRDKIVEVDVIVKCKAKMVMCNFNKPTDTEVIGSLFNCVGRLKIELRKCL